MRQKRKPWKLLICLGMSLTLAGTSTGCAGDRNKKNAYNQEAGVQREKRFRLPVFFAFDLIYPFHTSVKFFGIYFYCLRGNGS